MLNTGKTRHTSGPIPTNPAYFRFYDTAELKTGRPEPDPVHVVDEQIRNPEFLDFNSDGSQLTTSHHDGSVRLWYVNTSDHITLGSEGFNEPTSTHSRWTLSGQTIGTASPGFGTVGDVTNFTRVFNGKRGSRFIAMGKLDNDTAKPSEHSLTLNQSWATVGYRKLQVQFAIAAEVGQFDAQDYLIVEADTTADGNFDTQLATFTADSSVNQDLRHVGSGTALNLQFRDFLVDLPPGITQPVRFRMRARTDSGNEAIAFDSLRLLGEPIPPQLDSDADGTSDLHESIAGTDPMAASSRIEFSSDLTLEGHFRATLAGVRNRSYTLQRSIELINDWIDIAAAPTLSSHQSVELLDPDPPADRAFYRFTIRSH